MTRLSLEGRPRFDARLYRSAVKIDLDRLERLVVSQMEGCDVCCLREDVQSSPKELCK